MSDYSCTTIRAHFLYYSSIRLLPSFSSSDFEHLPCSLILSFSDFSPMCLAHQSDAWFHHFFILVLICLLLLYYYFYFALRELLYGTDYLCVDTYFRSYMDEDGYVPMALLSSYPNIACYAASIADLVSKLNAKEDSILEVDVLNETVRLKVGWDKVSGETHLRRIIHFAHRPSVIFLICPWYVVATNISVVSFILLSFINVI